MKRFFLITPVFIFLLLFSCTDDKKNENLHGGVADHEHMANETSDHDHGSTEDHEHMVNETGDHDHGSTADHEHMANETDDHDSPADEAAGPAEGAPAGEVKHSYHISSLEPGIFNFVYKTSGQIMLDKKDEIFVTAKSRGIVSFSDHFLYPGVGVEKDQVLFTLSGGNITENNTEVRFKQLSTDYNTASERYERARRLIAEQLIRKEDYLAAKQEYENTRAEYLNFSKTISEKGNIVISPVTGSIMNVFVTEGQMVSSGQKMASVIIEHNMVLRADIPASDLSILSKIKSANFSTGYSQGIYSTEKMNGRMISFGKSTGNDSYYIPVFFSIDYNNELIPGTFADVWLIGPEISNALVVPNEAIMEEFGKLYVFAEHEDGDIEKRFITTGLSDGLVTEVKSGLEAGMRIVTEGAYQVKLEQQGSSPVGQHQGHNH